jgi:hypothetical protein
MMLVRSSEIDVFSNNYTLYIVVMVAMLSVYFALHIVIRIILYVRRYKTLHRFAIVNGENEFQLHRIIDDVKKKIEEIDVTFFHEDEIDEIDPRSSVIDFRNFPKKLDFPTERSVYMAGLRCREYVEKKDSKVYYMLPSFDDLQNTVVRLLRPHLPKLATLHVLTENPDRYVELLRCCASQDIEVRFVRFCEASVLNRRLGGLKSHVLVDCHPTKAQSILETLSDTLHNIYLLPSIDKFVVNDISTRTKASLAGQLYAISFAKKEEGNSTQDTAVRWSRYELMYSAIAHATSTDVDRNFPESCTVYLYKFRPDKLSLFQRA